MVSVSFLQTGGIGLVNFGDASIAETSLFFSSFPDTVGTAPVATGPAAAAIADDSNASDRRFSFASLAIGVDGSASVVGLNLAGSDSANTNATGNATLSEARNASLDLQEEAQQERLRWERRAGAGDRQQRQGTDDADTILGGPDRQTIAGRQGHDRLFGNQGDDWLEGDEGWDSLYGGRDRDGLLGDDGHDALFGNRGDDWLEGSAGNDLLHGGKDDDWLLGGPGNDWLAGDRGDDRLYGNGGADTFVLQNNGGIDVIADYQPGIDLLMLDSGLAIADLAWVWDDRGATAYLQGQAIARVYLTGNFKTTDTLTLAAQEG